MNSKAVAIAFRGTCPEVGPPNHAARKKCAGIVGDRCGHGVGDEVRERGDELRWKRFVDHVARARGNRMRTIDEGAIAIERSDSRVATIAEPNLGANPLRIRTRFAAGGWTPRCQGAKGKNRGRQTALAIGAFAVNVVVDVVVDLVVD